MFDNDKTTFDNESTTLDKLFERIKNSHFKNRAERDVWEHNQTCASTCKGNHLNDTRDPWGQNDDTDCYDTLESSIRNSITQKNNLDEPWDNDDDW